MEKLLLIAGKAVAGLIGIIVATIALFRGVVTFLWGSHSDLGLLAAPFVAVVGLLIIAYIALLIVRHIKAEIARFEKQGEN